jgi:hypothetical protein
LTTFSAVIARHFTDTRTPALRLLNLAALNLPIQGLRIRAFLDLCGKPLIKSATFISISRIQNRLDMPPDRFPLF